MNSVPCEAPASKATVPHPVSGGSGVRSPSTVPAGPGVFSPTTVPKRVGVLVGVFVGVEVEVFVAVFVEGAGLACSSVRRARALPCWCS